MTKKRNPSDATFRNITALKKRVTALEATVHAILSVLAKKRGVVLKEKTR